MGVAAWLLGFSLAASAQDTADTGGGTDTGTDPGLDLDVDRDGWTPRQGDCDDNEPRARPDTVEVCEDRIDNDCDGLYDEECDSQVRMAGLRGGGGCTGSSSGAAGLFLLPLFAVLRRRSRRE